MDLQDNLDDEFEFDYDQVETVLADAECEASAAEIQAVLCGMLAAGLPRNDTGWQITLIEMINGGMQFNPEATKMMRQLFHWTAFLIDKNQALTPILLPDDTYPPIDRLEAMIEWSQGFLLGFGLQSGGKPLNNPEIEEALIDLAEVTKLKLEAEDNEETQAALFTLIEHIKVVVQLIFCEMVLKNRVDSNVQQSTLH